MAVIVFLVALSLVRATSAEETNCNSLLQRASTLSPGAKAVSPAPPVLMDADVKGVVADSLLQAKAQLEGLKSTEEGIKQDALTQKASKESAKSQKEGQKKKDCTWKCSGFGCLGKPFALLGNQFGHCKNLDKQIGVLNNEINDYRKKAENAQKEIDRLTALIASKRNAAETAKGLEESIVAKKAEIVLEHKLLQNETELNALVAEDKRSTHEAKLANLDGQMAAIDANITALQAVYDQLTENHTALSCEEKEAKKERICLKCGSLQKPCGDQCLNATERCHKVLGCACQAKPEAVTDVTTPSFLELSSAKEEIDAHPLRQQLQDARQRIGEAIHAHNGTIHSLAADLTLNDASIQQARKEKEKVKADFDFLLDSSFPQAKADLEKRKADAEAKMQAAKAELAKAIKDGDSAIAALKESLSAEIARLTDEKLSLKTAKENMEQTYLQETKAMRNSHASEINGISAKIGAFEIQLREFQNSLEKLKSDHNV